MTDVLLNLSNDLAGVVATADPGIVRVEGRRRLAASGIVWSADGVIVTAHHVVQQEDDLKVGLPDGQTVSATLLGRDPTTDLAVLRADAKKLSPPNWAESRDLKVGHLVLALGRPGRTVQATLGVISALGDEWRSPAGGLLDRYLQTDVVMYPGFSGGPLVNGTGAVVGLNTSALLRGVSLSVPTASLRRVVETLLTHGRVRRGYLGVSTQPVRLPDALSQQLNQETGLLLAAVEAGSPGEQGGLLLGDTIVGLDNTPIRHHDDLLGLLTDDRVGARVSLRIIRSGQVQEVDVVIGERS